MAKIRFRTRCRLMAMIRPRLNAMIRQRLKEVIRRRLETTPSPPSQRLLQITKYVAQTRNFVFSPWSIHLALCLLANGSTGSTKQEFLTFLQAENLDDLNLWNKQLLDSWTRPDEETAAFINSHHQDLLDSLTGKDEGDPFKFTSFDETLLDSLSKPYEAIPILTFAGGVWVDQSVTLNPTFITIAEDVYKGRAETLDFQDQTKRKEMIDSVNKWAEEATNGLIKSILSEDSINQSTRIVLANAVYFRERWSKQFTKSLTQEHKFYLLDGNTVDVPFMSSKGDRYIYDSKEFKILRLPYDKSSTSMYIILPSKRKALLPLLKKVVSDPKFVVRYAPELVRVGKFRIPKFKISCDFEVSKILQGLGLRSCFSDKAEFDEMVLDTKDGDIFKGSQVIHKSHIEVDEEGTEAASATMMDWCCSAGGVLTAPVDFVADHPFIYMVRDYKSGTILFMGHVVNPFLK